MRVNLRKLMKGVITENDDVKVKALIASVGVGEQILENTKILPCGTAFTPVITDAGMWLIGYFWGRDKASENGYVAYGLPKHVTRIRAEVVFGTLMALGSSKDLTRQGDYAVFTPTTPVGVKFLDVRRRLA